jgi:hypothetical protein
MAEIKENYEVKQSPDTLQIRQVINDTIQVLWLLFLWLNRFVNCTFFLPSVQFVPYYLVQFIPRWRQLPNSSCDATHQHPNNVK